MPETSCDVVVLGAGPAGLAAAWRASATGRSVTVLERSPRVGGMSASFEVAGVQVDHGSHRLHPATPPYLLAALRGLLGDDLQTRPRNGRLRLYDRWVGFPLRGGELIRAVPPAAAARIGRDALTSPLRRGGGSYAGTLRASLGPEMYEAMYAPYARKLWGLPGSAVDAEQARVRVTADTPWKVAARVLRRPRGGQGRVFHYPRRGFGQITDALAQAAVGAGADLRCGSEVVRVEPSRDGALVTTSGGEQLRAGRVLSTLPLPVLASLCDPPPPRAAVADAASLRFRAMVLVYLVHTGGRWTSFDAHYLPGPHTPVTRVSEPANYRVSADDPTDRTVLCAEIPCDANDPDDPVWTASDDDLAVMVRAGLAATDLPPVELADVVTRRLRHVYPVYEKGFGARLAGLEHWALAQPGVTTLGRLGLFAHDNTHHAMVMADAAARALDGPEGWDEAAWSAAREGFRDHVVED